MELTFYGASQKTIARSRNNRLPQRQASQAYFDGKRSQQTIMGLLEKPRTCNLEIHYSVNLSNQPQYLDPI